MKFESDDIKSIEACRPNSDDRQSPEFRPIAERIEQDAALSGFAKAVDRIDSMLAAEISNVPVPADFKKRLLASLDNSRVSPKPIFLGISRRNWVGLAVGIAASAVCLMVAFGFASPTIDQRTEIELVNDARKELKVLDDRWFEYKHANAEQRKSLPSGLLKAPDGVGQNTATSVLFFSYRQPQAYLMVVAGRSAKIKSSSPPPPTAGTGSNSGRYFGVWQSADHIYVLVVEGNKSDYDQLVPSIEKLATILSRNCLPHRHNRNS